MSAPQPRVMTPEEIDRTISDMSARGYDDDMTRTVRRYLELTAEAASKKAQQ